MASRGDDPIHKYRKERDRVKDSELSEQDRKAVLEFLAAFDENDLSHTYTNGDGERETLSYNSLETYGRNIRLIGKESDCDLLEHDHDSLTAVFSGFLENLGNRPSGSGRRLLSSFTGITTPLSTPMRSS